MGRIFYSLSGEGRGHATRSRTVLDRLCAAHEVTVFTYGDAHGLLAPFCERKGIELVEIPGMRFEYGARGRLDYLRTIAGSARYLAKLPGLIGSLASRMRDRRPDLVITDFEPSLPRAARRMGVPYISVDHQHFLSAFDLKKLPARLRRKARFLSFSVPLLYSRQAATIVSAFYSAPLVSGGGRVESVGVLLDDAVREAKPTRSGHLTAYLRRKVEGDVLEVLARAPMPVHVFGLGEQPDQGSLSFQPVSRAGFIESLASSEALVTTAGNQVIGEAFALGKPVLGIPEPGNFEQEINGWFLSDTGAGQSVLAEDFDHGVLEEFLGRLDEYRRGVQDTLPPGNDRVLELILDHLPGGSEAASSRDARRMMRA